MLLAALCSQVSAQSVDIDLSQNRQYVSVMGGDMERSAHVLDTASNPQEIADWLYKDIPNMWYSRVSYDRKQELVEGQPDLSFYDPAISAMKKVKQAKPSVKFWATLKSDYDGYGTTNNLPDWIYTGGGYNGGSYDPNKVNFTKYARFLADYLKYMDDNGVPIKVLSVSKEWQQVMSVYKEKQTIDKLKGLLNNDSRYRGVPVPLFAGPAGWGVVQTGNFIKQSDDLNFENRYWVFCGHHYDGGNESQWSTTIDRATAAGKGFIHEENGDGSHGQHFGAEPPFESVAGAFTRRCIHYRQGIRGEVIFEQFNGNSRWVKAIDFKSGERGVRKRGYYILKKFVPSAAGAHYISSTRNNLSEVDTMVFKKGKSVTLWLVNSGNSAKYPRINISGATLKNTSISRQVWNDSAAITGVTSTLMRRDNDSFNGAIGGKTMCVYTFTLN